MAVFVDRQQEIALWVEAEPGDVLAVGETEGMGFVAMRESAQNWSCAYSPGECAVW